MSKRIQLTQGKFTIVDNEDYDYLSKFKWHAKWSGRYFYATRGVWVNGKTKAIIMHREILSASLPKDVDHINHNTLDNRKKNLRICSRSQNSQNSIKAIRGSSKYKGVTWYRQTKKWLAQIVPHNKKIHLGYFENEIKAALAYDKAAKKIFGDYAKLNFR